MNPNHNSFLAKWVEYCLDPETGVPVEGTRDRVRWFVALDGKTLWADDPAVLFEEHGAPRNMIYGLGMPPEEMAKVPPQLLFLPKSWRFVPCGVYENPYLLPPRNTSYLANLLAQPKKNQLKFLLGSWLNIDVGGTYWKAEWVPKIKPNELPPDLIVCRGFDFGGGAPGPGSPNPDFTAGVKMGKSKMTGLYYILDVVRYQKTVHEAIDTLIKTAWADGDDVMVVIPRDSAAGGSWANSFTVKTLAENGVACKSDVQSGHSGKLQKFLPFCSLCEGGLVRMVEADWNECYSTELSMFTGGTRGQKDD